MSVNKSIKSKLYRYFKQRLNLKPSTNGFLRGNCPHCGGKFTFGVNIEKHKINCFKDCGITTSPLKLVMQLEELETRAELNEFLNIQQEYESYDSLIFNQDYSIKPKFNNISLPETFTPINMGNGIIADAARHSLTKRGFDITELAIQGVGYCNGGDYMGYIIFPFFEKSKLQFFQGRKFAGAGPKMKNPKEEDYGIGKTQLLYNKDALFIYKKIYLVESITNALTIGERGVGILGKKISNYQLSLILKSPCEEVVIMLDPDAMIEAYQLAMTLVQYKRVKVVVWEPWEDKKGPDVNDMGKKKSLRLAKSFSYENYSYFFKQYRKLKYDQGTKYTYNGEASPGNNLKAMLR